MKISQGDQAKRDQPFSVGTRAFVGRVALRYRNDISSGGWIYGEGAPMAKPTLHQNVMNVLRQWDAIAEHVAAVDSVSSPSLAGRVP